MMNTRPPTPPHSTSSGPVAVRPAAGTRPQDYEAAPAEYDALADLFLGEVGGAGSRARPAATPGVPVQPHGAVALPEARTPRLRLAGAESVAAPAGLVRETDENDRPTKRRGEASGAPIELVVLGHLPVLGSVWATQYAREVARAEGGAVAFLRLLGDQATLELVAGEGVESGDEAGGAVRTDFAASLAFCAERARRWIVRADAGREIELAGRPEASLVTLLTSSDEAARVGAYRALKELAGSMSAGNGTTRLRVSVMSAEGDHADALGAAESLAEAAAKFLGREVEARALVGRIRSSRAPRTVFAGRVDVSAADVLRVIAEISGPAAEPAVTVDRAERIVVAPAAKAAEPASAVETKARSEARSRPASIEPVAPPARVETATPARTVVRGDGVESLARYIRGATPLSARCPYLPGIELARDNAGVLHLMGITETGNADAVLGSLVGAGAWAAAHAGLLGAAGGFAAAQSAAPVLHLFVREPKGAKRLLDSEVRVHLLAAVEVEGKTGWYHAELN